MDSEVILKECPVYQADDLDRQLILLLQEDGRASYVELAQRLGVGESTVRRRLERLLAEGIIQIVACVDPRRVGLTFEAFVYIHADLDKLTQIARQLAAMPEVREVIYTSGNFELIVRLVLPSSEDLLPFLTRQIASLPGIQSTQTSYVLHVEKPLYRWTLPGEETRTPDGSASTVLLFDHNADLVEEVRPLLEAEGYRVVPACEGSDALACLREQRPALMLVDLRVDSPAQETIQTLCREARERGVAVLAVVPDELEDRAVVLADAVLSRPVQPAPLLERVRQLAG